MVTYNLETRQYADHGVIRLDDGRYCVLVIQTATERAEQEHAAFVRFMGTVLRRRG